jgi:hypothetical protein
MAGSTEAENPDLLVAERTDENGYYSVDIVRVLIYPKGRFFPLVLAQRPEKPVGWMMTVGGKFYFVPAGSTATTDLVLLATNPLGKRILIPKNLLDRFGPTPRPLGADEALW